MVDQLTYREQSRVFLGQAFQELQQGDLRQASEKGWGAASQIVKAVADHRRWNHHAHQLLRNAVSNLVDETGDVEIGTLFVAANGLHSNFYDGRLSRVIVEASLRQITRFVEKLEALLPAEAVGRGP